MANYQANFSQVVSESLYKYVFTTLSYANTKYKYIHTTRAIHISMMYQRTEIRQYVLWILFTLAWNNLWNKSLYVPLQIHLFKLFTTCLFYILRMCMTLECTMCGKYLKRLFLHCMQYAYTIYVVHTYILFSPSCIS